MSNTYHEFNNEDLMDLANTVNLAGYVFREPNKVGKSGVKFTLQHISYRDNGESNPPEYYTIICWNASETMKDIVKGDVVLVCGKLEQKQGVKKPDQKYAQTYNQIIITSLSLLRKARKAVTR